MAGSSFKKWPNWQDDAQSGNPSAVPCRCRASRRQYTGVSTPQHVRPSVAFRTDRNSANRSGSHLLAGSVVKFHENFRPPNILVKYFATCSKLALEMFKTFREIFEYFKVKYFNVHHYLRALFLQPQCIPTPICSYLHTCRSLTERVRTDQRPLRVSLIPCKPFGPVGV